MPFEDFSGNLRSMDPKRLINESKEDEVENFFFNLSCSF